MCTIMEDLYQQTSECERNPRPESAEFQLNIGSIPFRCPDRSRNMSINFVLLSQGFTYVALPAGPVKIENWKPSPGARLAAHGVVADGERIVVAVTNPN